MLESLNPAQLEAVTTLSGPVLVVAGAGSGKTRSLTLRIAHLIETQTTTPDHILAITFTNKAAREMKERLYNILGPQAQDIFVSTFHSLGIEILRHDGQYINLPSDFTVADPATQEDHIRAIVEATTQTQKLKVNIRQLLAIIMSLKADGLTPATATKRVKSLIPSQDQSPFDRFYTPGIFNEAKNKWESVKNSYGRPERIHLSLDEQRNLILIYFDLYQKELEKYHQVDFEDLLHLPVKLFRKYPEVLEKYQDRFQYVHVDEYQDTNGIQYRLTRLLAQKTQNIYVVGDPDQAIYSWRGADIRNILHFLDDYPKAKEIRLEENYRSTEEILALANHLIQHNKDRFDKNLIAHKQAEIVPYHVLCKDDREEANVPIQYLKDSKRSPGDIAILYRAKYQSRPFEQALVSNGIPYILYGGTRFYDRMEVRDLIAYLQLVANPNNDLAFRRVVNVPARNIGKTSLERLDIFAGKYNLSLMEAIEELANTTREDIPALPNATIESLVRFSRLIKEIRANYQIIGQVSLGDFIFNVIEFSKLDAFYCKKFPGEEGLERLQNMQELANAAFEFSEDQSDSNTLLEDFLSHVITLAEPSDYQDLDAPSVKLMTLHTAKGLEFPVVFIAGCDEGVFPIYRATYYDKKTDQYVFNEEERRLAYVGITRAEDELYLLSTKQRLQFGKVNPMTPSRFLEEASGAHHILNTISPKDLRKELIK